MESSEVQFDLVAVDDDYDAGGIGVRGGQGQARSGPAACGRSLILRSC